jgi:acyl dehydratase
MTTSVPTDSLTPEELDVFNSLVAKVGARLDASSQSNPIWGQVPYYTHVNQDLARQYAWAIGDLNPLWMDPEYARNSVVGRHVAPPSVVFPLGPGGLSGSIFSGLGVIAGTHETWGGANCTWYEWFSSGDRITAESRLKDVSVKVSARFGPMIKLVAQTDYWTQDRKLIASVDTWVFRKREADYADFSKGLETPLWNEEMLSSLREEKLSETRAGSRKLSPGEVRVGDRFNQIKGPYTLNMGLSYLCAWQGQLFGMGDTPWQMLEQWRRDGNGLPLEPHVSGHYDSQVARGMGLPSVYDFGPQRASWAIQLLTDWMGDAGFLQSLDFRVLGFNLVGDVQRIEAEIVAKAETSECTTLDCAIEFRNQRGVLTGSGAAKIRLTQ